jgi:hypothetical protein
MVGYSSGPDLEGGLIYGGGGGIANPSTTPPSQIATLSLTDFYGTGNNAYSAGVVVADPSINKEFLMLENPSGNWAYSLARLDVGTFNSEATLALPSTFSNSLAGWKMVRFGQDGLALLAVAPSYSTSSTNEILLLRGPFVTPQLLASQSAASINSASSASITHGAGNTLLTLTGSNFLPGVAVTWNGSYRTTKMQDSTHLTVSIPASDLSAAGSASLVATNPGASASSAFTISIN